MDLWVKTQNKEQLIKIEKDVTVKKAEEYKKMLNIADININDKEYDNLFNIDFIRSICEMEGYLLTTDTFLLGIYNSKERALEVLNEIQEKINYLDAVKMFDLSDIASLKAINSVLIEKNIDNLSNVYEMPKE